MDSKSLVSSQQAAIRERAHLVGGHLHAEIAARDHQSVARLDDRVDVLHRHRPLDLADHLDVPIACHATRAEQSRAEQSRADRRQRGTA